MIDRGTHNPLYRRSDEGAETYDRTGKFAGVDADKPPPRSSQVRKAGRPASKQRQNVAHPDSMYAGYSELDISSLFSKANQQQQQKQKQREEELKRQLAMQIQNVQHKRG